jgi:lipopolysaccharide/colanic/teichoic acid biosynthesis glycosyltransferase
VVSVAHRAGGAADGPPGGRSKVLDFEDVIKMDLRYQENWSLAYDLKLIVRTFLVIFSKRSGAA